MKFIIAVSSCELDRNNGNNEAIRRTWGRVATGLGVPYFLNVGGSKIDAARMVADDEILTPCPDLYADLGYKTVFNARHALSLGFDHMFQCFTDTYISIPRLLPAYEAIAGSPALRDVPMIGNYHWVRPAEQENHPCGGSGYWLNKEGMHIVANWHWDQTFYEKTAMHAEDRLVSALLRASNCPWHHDPLYDNESHAGGVSLHNKNISNHLSFAGHKYNPGWMMDEARQERTGRISGRSL